MKLFYFCTLLLLYPFTLFAQVCTQADINHPTAATLTWLDNSTDESGFILERKQDNAPFTVIATAIGANLTSYVDSTVTRGSVPITYTYRLQAYRASDGAKSVYSNEACITFAAELPPAPKPLPAPGGLTTAAVSGSTIRITWEDVAGATSYSLEGKAARGNEVYAEFAYVTNRVTYDWSGRKKYTPYCIRIRALNPIGEFSPVSCATTSK